MRQFNILETYCSPFVLKNEEKVFNDKVHGLKSHLEAKKKNKID